LQGFRLFEFSISMMDESIRARVVCLGVMFTLLHGVVSAQSKPATTPGGSLAVPAPAPAPATVSRKPSPSPDAAPVGVTPPQGYTIGADDQLSIRFWGDPQLSTDVVVRPDGKISVPLLNDVQAAGLTPEELNQVLEKAASKYISEPEATTIVREIRSRKVFVLGQVAKPSPVPLNSEMTVLQVLSAVGGLLEFADKTDIVILRRENGKEKRFKFNFNEVVKGKNVQQNIVLQPNDTVLIN
jgi:polysaccharide biosynthesis/export protein